MSSHPLLLKLDFRRVISICQMNSIGDGKKTTVCNALLLLNTDDLGRKLLRKMTIYSSHLLLHSIRYESSVEAIENMDSLAAENCCQPMFSFFVEVDLDGALILRSACTICHMVG